MVSEQSTRRVVRMLKDAGWTARPGKGSHTVWISPDGSVKFSLPDGHRTISAGVYRDLLKAMERSQR